MRSIDPGFLWRFREPNSGPYVCLSTEPYSQPPKCDLMVDIYLYFTCIQQPLRADESRLDIQLKRNSFWTQAVFPLEPGSSRALSCARGFPARVGVWPELISAIIVDGTYNLAFASTSSRDSLWALICACFLSFHICCVLHQANILSVYYAWLAPECDWQITAAFCVRVSSYCQPLHYIP